MSLKVAVRVRPFNKREIELHPSQTPKPIIQMNNNITTLLATETQKSKDFAFDYSFWSHSEYMELEDGYLKPTSEKYADQQKVFDTVGQEILDNAWEGYNCCLFAYGQTGSGKSYSMLGFGAN